MIDREFVFGIKRDTCVVDECGVLQIDLPVVAHIANGDVSQRGQTLVCRLGESSGPSRTASMIVLGLAIGVDIDPPCQRNRKRQAEAVQTA